MIWLNYYYERSFEVTEPMERAKFMGLWNELIPKILIKPKIKELKPAGGTYDTAADERKCYVILMSTRPITS